MSEIPEASPILMTPFTMAERFLGHKEVAGALDNPQIMAMLQLDAGWPKHDETPWCSAFANYVCHLLGDEVPRSKSLRARSWLEVGHEVPPHEAEQGFDVVVFWRRRKNGPWGHVGFYAGRRGDHILVLGGNQGNQVSIAPYLASRLLAVRRLV